MNIKMFVCDLQGKPGAQGYPAFWDKEDQRDQGEKRVKKVRKLLSVIVYLVSHHILDPSMKGYNIQGFYIIK